MGKKNSSINYRDNFNFRDGENFNRMNYLFKLSDYLYDKNQNLSICLIGIMKEISKRNVIRIDKKFKRLLCKKCNNLLYKDKNSNMEFKNKSGKHCLLITCSLCKEISKIIIF